MEIKSPNKIYKRKYNLVFSCQYHIIFTPKYRRRVLTPPIDTRLKQLILEKQTEVTPVEYETSVRIFGPSPYVRASLVQ